MVRDTNPGFPSTWICVAVVVITCITSMPVASADITLSKIHSDAPFVQCNSTYCQKMSRDGGQTIQLTGDGFVEVPGQTFVYYGPRPDKKSPPQKLYPCEHVKIDNSSSLTCSTVSGTGLTYYFLVVCGQQSGFSGGEGPLMSYLPAGPPPSVASIASNATNVVCGDGSCSNFTTDGDQTIMVTGTNFESRSWITYGPKSRETAYPCVMETVTDFLTTTVLYCKTRLGSGQDLVVQVHNNDGQSSDGDKTISYRPSGPPSFTALTSSSEGVQCETNVCTNVAPTGGGTLTITGERFEVGTQVTYGLTEPYTLFTCAVDDQSTTAQKIVCTTARISNYTQIGPHHFRIVNNDGQSVNETTLTAQIKYTPVPRCEEMTECSACTSLQVPSCGWCGDPDRYGCHSANWPVKTPLAPAACSGSLDPPVDGCWRTQSSECQDQPSFNDTCQTCVLKDLFWCGDTLRCSEKTNKKLSCDVQCEKNGNCPRTSKGQCPKVTPPIQCKDISNCRDCTTESCMWCANTQQCMEGQRLNATETIPCTDGKCDFCLKDNTGLCPMAQATCSNFTDCMACTSKNCMWCGNSQTCVEGPGDVPESCGNCKDCMKISTGQCPNVAGTPTSCSNATDCISCGQLNCVWCASSQSCVEGQWAEAAMGNATACDGDCGGPGCAKRDSLQCQVPEQECKNFKSCTECTNNSHRNCGWCSDTQECYEASKDGNTCSGCQYWNYGTVDQCDAECAYRGRDQNGCKGCLAVHEEVVCSWCGGYEYKGDKYSRCVLDSKNTTAGCDRVVENESGCPKCGSYKACEACAADTQCGFCDEFCLEGDKDMAYNRNQCKVWEYFNCTQPDICPSQPDCPSCITSHCGWCRSHNSTAAFCALSPDDCHHPSDYTTTCGGGDGGLGILGAVLIAVGAVAVVGLGVGLWYWYRMRSNPYGYTRWGRSNFGMRRFGRKSWRDRCHIL